MSALYKQVGRPIVLTTPLGPDALHAVGLTGREAVSEPYRFTVAARASKHTPVPFEDLLGQQVSVRLAMPGKPDRFLHGVVARLAQGKTDDEFTHYTLDLVPRLWLLTKNRQSRVFVQRTAPEILKEVLAGMPVEWALGDEYPKREFCVQYRETDFAFAGRLMEEEGIYYFFKHAPDGHTLVVTDGPHAHPALPGRVRQKAAADFEPTEEEFVFSLGKVQQLVTGRVHLRDHHFQVPHDPLAAEHGVRSEVAVGQVSHALRVGPTAGMEVYDYPGEYAARFDAVEPGGADQRGRLRELAFDNGRTAKLRLQAEAARAVELSGAGYVRGLAPGHTFELAAADAPSGFLRADGGFFVTAVEHKLEAGGFRSNDGAAFRYTNAFTCVPAGVPYRPERATPRPRIDGVQTAVVVGPAGEEIHTDKHGRVRLRFHWDRQERAADGSNSPWVRVSTPHAGKGFGGVCVPRVDEEVVVSFLEGDPDRPIVVGRVYNDRETPPFKLPEQKMVSGMKSNTYPGGGGFNEVSMDDTKGKERIFIHAQFNQDKVVEHDETVHVKHDRTETVENDETITVNNDRTETVKNNEKVTVGVNHTHAVGANHTETVGAHMTLSVGATKNEAVALTSTETVGLAKATTVGAAYALTVGAAMNVAVGLAAAEQVGTTKTVVVGERLEIVCGAAKLVMEASGAITLVGTSVKIDGGSAVDIDAAVIDLN